MIDRLETLNAKMEVVQILTSDIVWNIERLKDEISQIETELKINERGACDWEEEVLEKAPIKIEFLKRVQDKIIDLMIE